MILIGAGEGCYGIEHLVRNRDVEETVKGIVNFFGDFEPKSIGDTDEDKIYWYMRVFPYLNHCSKSGSPPEYILVLETPF